MSHSLNVRSQAAETTCFPSAVTTIWSIDRVCPISVWVSSPVIKSQTLMVASAEAETMRMPFGVMATELTALVCPVSVCTYLSVCNSRTLKVLSLEAETIHIPSGDIAAAFTICECATNVWVSNLLSKSQTLRVDPSAPLIETTRLPSEAASTALTGPEYAATLSSSVPLARSHIFRLLSSESDIARLPSRM